MLRVQAGLYHSSNPAWEGTLLGFQLMAEPTAVPCSTHLLFEQREAVGEAEKKENTIIISLAVRVLC